MKNNNKILTLVDVIASQNNLSHNVVRKIKKHITIYLDRNHHKKQMNEVFIELRAHHIHYRTVDDWFRGYYDDLTVIGLDLNQTTPDMLRKYVGEEGYKYFYYAKLLYDQIAWFPEMHPGLKSWIDKFNIQIDTLAWDDIWISIILHTFLYEIQYSQTNDMPLPLPLPSKKNIHQSYCNCGIFYT